MLKPCENPNCKSCGKPHPNCRCYAKGGGVVPDDDLADDQSSAPSLSEITADSSREVPPEDLAAGEEVPESDLAEPSDGKYETANQRIIGDLEAAGKGGLGFVSPLIETKLLGVDPADIAGRAERHTGEHAAIEGAAMAASLFAPYGPLKGAMSVLGHAIPAAVKGSQYLNAVIQGASFVGSSVITKNLLHVDGGDPNESVSAALLHMGAAGVVSAATHGAFNILGKAADVATNSAMAARAEKFLASLAETGKPVTKGLARVLEMGASYMAAKRGHDPDIITNVLQGGGAYKVLREYLNPYVEKIIDKPLTKANAYVTDAIIGALLKENALSVPAAFAWARKVSNGDSACFQGVESLFKAGASKIAPEISDHLFDDFKKNIEDGAPQTQIENSLHADPAAQGFANGGEVKPATPGAVDHFAVLYPESNMMLNQAKGRIYSYLNSIRPLPNQAKLPFDDAPADKQKQRDYDRAVKIAISPIKILQHVNDGDLTAEDMKHFSSMYPDVHQYLSKKITERVMKAQLDGEKPPYKKRQAMSLFLGASLDTCITPQAIMAAQNVFAQKRQQQQQAPAPKGKGTKSLSKTSNSYLTDDQARETRQQKV